ncbi:MAG: hypothetical protein ACK49D_07740 [Flavobacteriia bacterium]|jgi:hypothetical protein
MSNNEAKSEKTIAFAQQTSIFFLFVGVFLGSLYMFDGNLFMAIPTSAILVAGMYYIVWYMVGAKMGKKRGGFSFGERMIWVLYALVSIPVTFIALHAFNVEIQERAIIEQKGIEKLNTLNSLKGEYKKSYELFLDATRTDMIFQLNRCFVSEEITSDDLKRELPNIDDAFLRTVDKNNINESVTVFIDIERMKFVKADTSLFGKTQEYIDLQKGKIINFSRLSINGVLTDIDQKLTQSKEALNTYLKENAGGAQLKTNIDSALEPTLIAQPWALFNAQLNPLSFLIIVVIQFLMLIPYFMAPSRTYGTRRKPDNGSSDVVEW